MTIQKSIAEGAKPANKTPTFCTGFGQYDTHAIMLSSGEPNSAAKAGTPYQAITGKEIGRMVENPPSVAKEKAQWFIPSDYRTHDAREHEIQRSRGFFWWLPLDLDENSPTIEDVAQALVKVVGDAATRIIYSSRSAEADKLKWRALIPLAEPISGADYWDTVEAFNYLLEEASQGTLIADPKLRGAGQIIYLPNRGDHYEHDIHKGKPLRLGVRHPIIKLREETRRKRAEAEANAREWSAVKAKRAPTDTSSIVDAFNSANNVADLLTTYGYKQAGNSSDYRSPMQTSGSYATRDYGTHWISLSASDAAADLGCDTKTGQRFGDAFDLFVHFNHGGDFGEAVKSYAKEIGQDFKAKRKEAAKIVTPDTNPAALKITKQIIKSIRNNLPDLQEDPFVDPLAVQGMIEGAFWSGAKSRLFLLNEFECLVQCVLGDAWKFLCRRFGAPVDVDAIITQLENGQGGQLDLKKDHEARKAISAATVGPIIDHLKYENQRDAVEWSVDMFGTRSRLDIKENVARIVLTHRPLEAADEINSECLADYQAHFPLLEEMLEYIVAGRFALDRKKSYLWMFAASDWGKGFLMGALTDLGLVVQMSVKEIEAMFEGKPAGRKPEDFKRAMILAVDEFKTVKSELKQLQSEIHLAPKFQLTARVEIFTKLFLSAESVGSLVGENGVEDQFANRMSMLTGSGTLNERAIYKADQGKYYRTARAYIAKRLNRLISDYQALGREGAEQRADTYLNAFIARHGLDQHYERLSASYPEIADQAVDWIRAEKLQKYEDGKEYITHANKVLDDYLSEHYTISEVGTLRRRKTEILALMSEDGKGIYPYRVKGRQVKALKLKP